MGHRVVMIVLKVVIWVTIGESTNHLREGQR